MGGVLAALAVQKTPPLEPIFWLVLVVAPSTEYLARMQLRLFKILHFTWAGHPRLASSILRILPMRSCLIAGVAATEEIPQRYQLVFLHHLIGNSSLPVARAEQPFGITSAVMFSSTRVTQIMAVLLWRALRVASAEQQAARAVALAVNRLATFLRNFPEAVGLADTMARRVRPESVAFFTFSGHNP
jgi:hypothetical protein